MTEDGAFTLEDFEAGIEALMRPVPHRPDIIFINTIPRHLWHRFVALEEARFWAVDLHKRPLSPEEEARWS